MIKLTTPVGTIYLRKDAIIAIANTLKDKTRTVKTEIWVTGQEDAFNILEDVETVYALLEPVGGV
jgi:hypothetical protein